MDYIYFIGFGIGSTIGFILVYRNFELCIRGRTFVLFISGTIILGCDIFWAWNTLYIYGVEQDQVTGELLRYLSFHMNIGTPSHTMPLLLGYLLITWACLGTIVNRIIKVKKTDRS